jgi:hypothetical protein
MYSLCGFQRVRSAPRIAFDHLLLRGYAQAPVHASDFVDVIGDADCQEVVLHLTYKVVYIPGQLVREYWDLLAEESPACVHAFTSVPFFFRQV